MSIKVLSPGALSTVQDLGRQGYQQYGILCCGVMDRDACAAANRLLDNPPEAAVLEFTLLGGSYLFDADTVIALAGADMRPAVNGQPCPMYRPVQIKAGEVLALHMAQTGCRTYLAVAGGIDVPRVMGSRSTDLKCGIGGYRGRALRAGDLLNTGESHIAFARIAQRQEAAPVYASPLILRAIGGPQEDSFTPEGLRAFYGSSYILTEHSDRMGCRLAGPRVESKNGTDIISDGIVFGSVQVTSAGQPIVLMADHQTTGGYAKIATVCSFDLPGLAQRRPGDTIRFQKITLEKARQIAAAASPQSTREGKK